MARRLILDEMDRVRHEADRVFKNFLEIPRMAKMKLQKPKANIQDKGKELVVKMNLPGMKKQDIEVNVLSNSLEVKAQHKNKLTIEKKGLFKQESSYKGFYNSFPLPAKVMPDKSKVLYKKGVLEIHAPKAQ